MSVSGVMHRRHTASEPRDSDRTGIQRRQSGIKRAEAKRASLISDDALCYGDEITLFCADCNGYVFNCESGSLQNGVSVFHGQDRDQPEGIPDTKSIRFQICTKNRYKQEKNRQKYSELAEKVHDNAEIQRRAYDAEAAAAEEAEENQLEEERQRGKKLRYGQVIQLLHGFTNKFLHVSTTQTSQQDKNNMRVSLLGKNGKQAQFTIMPRFKVKSEGDVVQDGDQIVLESIKTPGQYLHASAPYQMTSLLNVCEMNLSVNRSGFTIGRVKKAENDEPGLLRAGGLVRFLHKELDAYLVAQGIFNRNVTENVHMRVRKTVGSSFKQLFPSSSAITYWQVEAQSSIADGEVIHWKQHIRLRHMTTRQYLMVKSNGQVSLTKDGTDPLTVFRLHPVTETRKEVEVGTYTRVEHVITDKWLHAEKDELYIRQELMSGPVKLNAQERLRWDTATLKKVSAIGESMYDDAFTIQYISEELVELYYFVAGMVPCIQDIAIRSSKGQRISVRNLLEGTEALKELQTFMIYKGIASKRRQKLLRNLGVIDLLIECLMSTNISGENVSLLETFLTNAYKTIETYLQGDSRKNELYTCKYIHFFSTQFSKENDLGYHSTTMITELIRDNRKVLDRITKEEIKDYTDLVKHRKNYRFLDLLGVLCVCDGLSLPENQTFIAKRWLEDDQDGVLLTETGDRIDQDEETVYVSTNLGKSWRPIHQFCGTKTGDAGLHTSEEYLFLERQLDLFGKLCAGRNEYCIKLITVDRCYLTWREAFLCLCDERLPPALRAKYCDLITGMFVDVGDVRSILDGMHLTYVYDEVGRGDLLQKHVANMPGRNNEIFSPLRNWLNKFFDKNKDMTASEIGMNLLIEQVLRLLHHLVMYGYYSDTEHIKQLLTPLLSLLDGRNDKPLKKRDCKGVTVRYKGRVHNVEELISNYRSKTRFQKSPEAKAIVNAKYRAMEVVELIMDIQHHIRLEKFIDLYKREGVSTVRGTLKAMAKPDLKRTLAMADLKRMMKTTSFFEENLPDILMDLSYYDYSKMTVKAMHLLNKYFSVNDSLFKEVVQAQVLITDKSIEVHRTVVNHLPQLQRLLSVQIREDQVPIVCETLRKFTRMCHIEGEPDERHPMNQTILVNNGVLDIILNLLNQKFDAELETKYSGFREVLRNTMALFKFLIKGNRHVQERAFANLDFLLDIRGVDAELGEALLEIFNGNEKTCMQVNSRQIQKIVQNLAALKDRAPEMLDMLCAIVKTEESNLPLKQNQIYVMRAMMKKYHDIAQILEAPKEDRQRILRNQCTPEDMSYLISLIDLLASCAEGENPYIESLCQTILPVDEVIETLNDDKIDDNLKRPYLRYLLWVFVNTGVSAIMTGIMDLPVRILPWRKHFIQNVQNVTAWVHKNRALATKLLKKAPPKSAVGQTKQDWAYATLHFMFDAALPFLSVFYQKSFSETAQQQTAAVTEQLAKALVAFNREVGPLISQKIQLETLNRAGIAIITKSNMDKQQAAAFVLESPQTALSEAQDRYHSYYNREHDENNRLNDFSKKLADMYHKANTVGAQLDLTGNKQRYSTESDAERLPLGSEFQSMVKFFITEDDHQKKNYSKFERVVHALNVSCSKLSLKEQFSTSQVALDIKCLQVLRAALHNLIVQLPQSKKNPRYQTIINEINKIHEEFNKQKSIVKTMPLLNRPQRELNGQFLSFLIVMFFNANEESQTAMENYFLGTREELFFHNAKDMMQKSIQSTKERRILQAQREARQALDRTQKATLLESLSGGISSTAQNIALEGRKLKKEALLKEQPNGTLTSVHSKASKPGSAMSDQGPKNDPNSDVFHDEYNIEILFQVLSFMCDGQNTVLQDYLREQPDNIKTINLVGEVLDYFNLIYTRIDSSNISLAVQILTTVLEFCSGNPENQHVMFDHGLIDYINYILRQPDFKGVTPKQLMELHNVIGQVLLCHIEENNPVTTKLITDIRNTVDVDGIRRVATQYYQIQKMKSLTPSGREKYLKVGFKYHFVLERLADIRPTSVRKSKKTDKELADAMKFYERETMSIEVTTDNGLQRVRFRVNNKGSLRDQVKDALKWSVDRSTPSNKLRDLLDWSKDIIDDIDYQERIRSWKVIDLLIRGWNPMNNILLFLSLLINIFMIATWQAPGALGITPVTNGPFPTSITSPVPANIEQVFNYALWSLGPLHNVISLLIFITFLISNRPKPPSRDTLLKSCRSRFTNRVQKQERSSHLRIKLISFYTVYYILFLGLSIAGTAIYGYFFAFHLLNIIYNNNLLQRVCRAVTQNGKSLLWVAVLGIFVLYIFTLVAFAFMRSSLDPDGEQTLYCQSLFQCLITIIRFGLLGELFEFMRPHAQILTFKTFALAAIFHVAFFIIITTIGLNIVFGIILDTFSELRLKKWEAENDMKSTCFICSRSSFEFERQSKGFEYHVKFEHNMWAYIFFLIHLRSTEENDFTNIEMHVNNLVKQQKLDFFPIGQALSLTSAQDDWTQAKIVEILQKLNSLISKQEAQEREKQLQKEIAHQERWEEQHRDAALLTHDKPAESSTSVPFRGRLVVAPVESPPEARRASSRVRFSPDDDDIGVPPE